MDNFSPTKTGVVRFVPVVAPLAADIETWRASSPDASLDALLFPSATGEPWTQHDWQNWRNRVFRPAAAAIGLTGVRPYDCRHTYVSLRIHQGDTAVEIAHDVGHAPSMTFDTYAHVIHEYRGRERREMAELIADVRAVAAEHTGGRDLDAIREFSASVCGHRKKKSPRKRGLRKVEPDGIEPTTSSLPARRSPS